MLVMTLFLYLLVLATVSSGESSSDRTIRDRQHTLPDGEHNSHYDHEKFLGDPEEAGEFDELAPEEARERLEILAKKMDLDEDGFIDKKELSNWLSHSMKLLNKHDSEERFKTHDTDKDKFVDWNEYKDYELENISHDGKEPAAFAREYKKQLDGDKPFFDAADVNKDGKLDIDEYISFSHPDDHMDQMVWATLNAEHKIQDINKDGKIDFDEYLKNRDKNHDVKEKNLFQSTLDKNGDGMLDKQEIIDWVRQEKGDPVEDQTDHFISAADDNRDGKLSIAEIVGHHDVFVGSEITNFGDDLLDIERFEDEL